jgi:hypothetical protein
MSGHNAAFELGQTQKGVDFEGAFLHIVAATPTDTIEGYGKGALAVDTSTGRLYINQGTFDSATWQLIGP